MIQNWKTTVPGVLVLAAALWNAWQTKTIDWPTLQNALAGIGLIAAKDFNVTRVKA